MTKALKIIFTVLKYLITVILVGTLFWFSYKLVDSRLSDLANADVPNRMEAFGLTLLFASLILAIINGVALVLSLISFIIIKINRKLRKVKKLTIWYIVLMVAPVVNMLIFVLIAIIMKNYS